MKQFQCYRLDTVNHCLWSGDTRVSLTPKAFDILRYLVEHADRLVTQEEILEALWPQTYVNPEVVKKYILGIRKALGDRHDKPEFIETFPRRGYQFVAPVSEVSVAARQADAEGSFARKMVGREAAMGELDGYLGQVVKGKRQIVFITGEAGVGKTTLVDEFQQAALRRPNLRVIRGQCVEGFGGKEAYYPILEALGQWVREAGGASVISTLARQAPTWLIQFPSLVKAEQREALQKEILGATRERMVREICEALESLTAQESLVLVLEDLHWVDPSTLDFLSALARRRGPARLLLLGTYRPADVIISQSPLKALKQDLVLHHLAHELNLERLEEPDVAEYLGTKFVDSALPEGFANLIYRHSGGNALFMVTILQDMEKKGLIAQDGGKWKLTVALEDVDPSVPETLDQLIELQFQQLNPVEQRVLRSASVAGEHFSVWAIATATEMEESAIEEACEGLTEKLQFVKCDGIHELPNGEISAHYGFRHSLYREVLYRRLSEMNRSKLHLLLAKRLKAHCDPCELELATELAVHFEGGRDYEEAIRYLILGARNAVGRFAYRDSIDILNHALELVTKLIPAHRAELKARILEFIGDAHFALGALPESAQAYGASASEAEQAGLKAVQLHVLMSAMYPLGFVDPGEGIAALEKAVKIGTGVNDPHSLALANMLAAGCRLVFDRWSTADSELCTSAYETLDRLETSRLDPYQRIVYAHVLMLRGDYREALDLCERSVAEASAAGVGEVVNFLAHFGALSAKTNTLLVTGQLGKLLQITKAAKAYQDENLPLYWMLSFTEARIRAVVFDFEGARRDCQASFNAPGGYPRETANAIDQIAAGSIAVQAGNYAQAIEHFRNLQEPAVPTKFFLHWEWRLLAQLEAGNAWLQSGNVPTARVTADRCLQSALDTANPHLQALAWELKSRVAMAENDFGSARESIEQAVSVVNKFEIPLAAWQVYATAWKLNTELKEHKTAEASRQRAEASIRKIADSFEADEPLRATFLAATPVRQVLGGGTKSKAARPQRSSSATH